MNITLSADQISEIKKQLQIKSTKSNPNHRITYGQVYRISGEYYLLSHVGNSDLCFINLASGNLWTYGTHVKNLADVTLKEFGRLIGPDEIIEEVLASLYPSVEDYYTAQWYTH